MTKKSPTLKTRCDQRCVATVRRRILHAVLFSCSAWNENTEVRTATATAGNTSLLFFRLRRDV